MPSLKAVRHLYVSKFTRSSLISTLTDLFKTNETRPLPAPEKDGYPFEGFRHIAFQVDSVDAVLAALGADAKITLGPLDFSDFIPGWRTVWVADPEGNIVEITQGYQDQDNPPALD